MTYKINICPVEGVLTAEQIIDRLDINVSLQAAHRMAVRDLISYGMRYSNEDSDVLAAAFRAIGKTEVPTYAEGWVKLMNQRIADRGGHTDAFRVAA